MRTIEDELRRFIVDNFLYGREEAFSDDASFLEMGMIDSTGILELVTFLEKTYHITLDDTDLVPANLDSISRLAVFVCRKSSNVKSATRASLQVHPVHSD
jgi:acyl carrier protein